MEWQPIETAPKDGTVFLAFWDKDGDTRYVCAKRGRRGGPIGLQRPPTHWMPLPEPPKD